MLRGESRFVDVLETALYNGTLSGISLDGTGFFYQNPLASHGDRHRHEWFGCACCPPNIARLLASLGQYIYAESDEGLWVNLYVGGTADAIAAGNVPVRLTQKTDYPWTGDITLTITPTTPVHFTLNLRIPGWCEQFEARINGEVDNAQVNSDGYLSITREWRADDRVELQLAMPVTRVHAHPLVRENLGRSALRRGPLVYCFEEIDNPDGAFQTLSLANNNGLETTFDSDLLGGVTLIRGTGSVLNDTEWEDSLYITGPTAKQTAVTAIPYYAWCNRGTGKMAVWVL